MSPSPEQPKSGADIVVGAPTSAARDYQVEGPLTRQGYELWAEWTNARGGIEVAGVRHKVRLDLQDDKSQPQLAAQLAEQMLTGDHAQFLLAPFGTPLTAAVAPVAEK